jgi:Flp pilus assembly protein TadG
VSLLRGFVEEDLGTTVVEFALVAPVLFVVLICCLDFARALNAYVIVTNASRDGARFATMNSSEDAVRAYVARRMSPLAIDPLDMTCPPLVATHACVKVTYTPSADPVWSTAAPLPWSVNVEIRYPWQAATMIAGSFLSASGTRTFDVASTMEAMR